MTSRSNFFRIALSGRWEEASARIVNLPDDQPELFALYLNHVHSWQIGVENPKPGESPLGIPRAGIDDTAAINHMMQEHYKRSFQLYILGEKLGDVFFKDATIFSIFKQQEKRYKGKRIMPTCQFLSLVYEGTPVGSPCRRILIDYLLCRSSEKLVEFVRENMDIIPKEAMVDLFAARLKDPTKTNVVKQAGMSAYLSESPLNGPLPVPSRDSTSA